MLTGPQMSGPVLGRIHGTRGDSHTADSSPAAITRPRCRTEIVSLLGAAGSTAVAGSGGGRGRLFDRLDGHLPARRADDPEPRSVPPLVTVSTTGPIPLCPTRITGASAPPAPSVSSQPGRRPCQPTSRPAGRGVGSIGSRWVDIDPRRHGERTSHQLPQRRSGRLWLPASRDWCHDPSHWWGLTSICWIWCE